VPDQPGRPGAEEKSSCPDATFANIPLITELILRDKVCHFLTDLLFLDVLVKNVTKPLTKKATFL